MTLPPPFHNFLYSDRAETRISTPVYMASSITSLEKKTWPIAEPNSLALPGSKLVQHKDFLTKFRVVEACYGLSGRNSGIPAAVVVAVIVRLHRWSSRIYRYWAGVVMRGLQLVLRSWADSIWFNICQKAWNCALVNVELLGDFNLR